MACTSSVIRRVHKEKCSRGRTKCESIIVNALAHFAMQQIFEKLESVKYLNCYGWYIKLQKSEVSACSTLILWHTDLLLGNDHKTNETTAVARQRPMDWLESGFLYVASHWWLCTRQWIQQWGAVFSMWSVPRGYKWDRLQSLISCGIFTSQ
jgi:hypothetical protein